MPMPRTKVQGLGAHVSSMANSARGYVFGSGDRSSQQSKSLKGGAGLLGDDSSSDSNSSDSDSEISDAEGTQSFLSKINAATASKKAKASESAAKSSATKSAPGDTPRPKTLEPAQKNGTKAIIKSPAVSSSQSKIAAIKKESAKDDSDTTSSDSSSEEDSSSSESSDSDESGDEAKDAGAKLDTESGKKAAPPAKTGDDSSSESDSESEEEVANAKSSKSKATKVSTQVSKPTKAAAKEATKEATKEVAPASDSDSESSEDEAEQSLKTKAMAKKGAASAVSNGSAKSKDASSLAKAPNVAAEESFSEDDSDVEMADESFALARTDDVDPDAVEEFVREGFQLRKASENTQANEVLEMFKKAKREGKQIWYFTTPASVPISVVEKMEFPMKNAQTGDSIVSHDGVDYGVDLGASGKPSTFQILVPAKKGASYDVVDRPVDHTMHLKRITQLAATDFTAKPKPQVSYSKPPRPQPADLKRRFTPIGVPTPVLPPLVPNPKKKRGGDVAMVDAVSEGKDENQGSSKKSKKRKLADDAVKASKEEKKAKKAKTASEEQVTKANAGASLANSQPIKKASPVPVPSPGGRAPSFSQPAPSAAASVSTPVTSKRKKSKSGEKANDTPATDTLSSKVKKSKKTKSDASVRQTPVPIPTIPGLKK
ncbi:hypothetical protein RB601_005518 [Gaeumannomyces tritici]